MRLISCESSRNLQRVGLLAALALALNGCFVTRLEAPDNQTVRLLPKDELARYRTEYKNFYLLYGALPLWPVQPSEIIAKEHLVEARAQTRDTVSDGVITAISMLFPISVFTQHVVVEGNRAGDLARDRLMRHDLDRLKPPKTVPDTQAPGPGDEVAPAPPAAR
ncbi:hypothetical protein [Methylotetracoccus oryzae]|uniref:hypothetical protein n=1 Tax=Methylotetracoccus oryzae TaxID=1919059 RepID=UPI00111887F6|nr:hypothetical protein [Methylotetracoccus oryzae]